MSQSINFRFGTMNPSPFEFSNEELARLLALSRIQTKTELHSEVCDLGVQLSEEQLDEVLEYVITNPLIVSLANKLHFDKVVNQEEPTTSLRSHQKRIVRQIRERMKDGGLSAADLSIACNISKDELLKLLYGRRTPTFHEMVLIAVKLKCNWDLSPAQRTR